jgi:23S rRNA (uracil1939-C5)-methyltransferase
LSSEGTVANLSFHVQCRHFGICGGCSLQHLSYTKQLAQKESALLERLPLALREPGGPVASPIFLPILGNDETPWAFRQKVAFVFGSGPGGRGLVMGHYEQGSHGIVPVEECPVHSVRANRIAFALRDRLAQAGIRAAGPSLAGLLRHILIRTTKDDREAVAMLVVTRNDKSLRRPVRALLDSKDRPDGFFINIHDSPGPFIIGDKTIKIAGRSHVRETVGGITYLISPEAFFQTNVRAAEVLQRSVTQGVTGAARVLDLYCGSGLFSLPLAAAGARVTGIDENRQAIRDADANVRLNRIPDGRVRFIAARVEEGLARAVAKSWDAVILDPPRQGCPKPILSAVFERLAPPRAVYVSCNPDMLANELPVILDAGYRVERLEAVDMFPHTDHIETVVRLTKRIRAARLRG